MLILLAGACLGWIALLSLVIVVFTGTGVSAGWIVAGALFFALAVWLLILLSEFRRAVTSPESFLKDESDADELDLEGETGVGHRLGLAVPGTDRVSACGGDIMTGRHRISLFGQSRSSRTARPYRSGVR